MLLLVANFGPSQVCFSENTRRYGFQAFAESNRHCIVSVFATYVLGQVCRLARRNIDNIWESNGTPTPFLTFLLHFLSKKGAIYRVFTWIRAPKQGVHWDFLLQVYDFG